MFDTFLNNISSFDQNLDLLPTVLLQRLNVTIFWEIFDC